MELGTIPTYSGTGGFELHGAEEHYHQLDSSGHMRSGTEVEMQVGRSEWAANMFCHFVSAVKKRGIKDEQSWRHQYTCIMCKIQKNVD